MDHAAEKGERVKDNKERKNILVKYSRCFSCLKKDHRLGDCNSKLAKCSICQKGHNTALHEDGGANQETPSTPKPDQEGGSTSGDNFQALLQVSVTFMQGVSRKLPYKLPKDL